MKKALLALAVSVAAVSGAHAAWDTGYNAGNLQYGNGEAVFEAYDLVTGKSYIQDLGVRYDDLVSGAALNGQTFTVDLSVFAGSAAGNAVWQIAAGSGNKRNAAGTANDFSKFGYITTQDISQASVNNQTSAVITNSLSYLNQVNTIVGMVSGNTAVNGSVTETNGFGPTYFGGDTTTTGYFSSTFGIDISGDIAGETMNLWRMGFGTSSNTKVTTLLGTVKLAGNTLTLGTAPTPTVPVPAAAWLMGSALVGLGGVARRRNKA